MGIEIIIWILFIHFIADFICQSDKMALNESFNIWYLLYHVSAYIIIIGIILMPFYIQKPDIEIGKFFTLNFLTHWIIDFIILRIKAKHWEQRKRHWFFVMIGFEQVLHISILLISWSYYIR